AKAYYDYAKVEELEQAKMMAQFGQPSQDKPPTQPEIDAQRAMADAELEDLVKKDPQDSTAALLVARTLKTKLDLAGSNQKAAQQQKNPQMPGSVIPPGKSTDTKLTMPAPKPSGRTK